MKTMYEIVKNVINSKTYELTDILTKIGTLWVQGSLSLLPGKTPTPPPAMPRCKSRSTPWRIGWTL